MKTKEKKTDINRREKTEQIYNEALKVFAKFEFRKTSLEDIAKELKMTKSNLYLYFKDKRDLYEKSVAFALKRWQASAVASMESEKDPVKQLVNLALTGWAYLSKDSELRNIIINDPDIFPLYPEEDHFYKINVDSMNAMKDILKKGIREKKFRKLDVEQVAPFLYSVYIMFIIKTYIKPEGPSMDKSIQSAVDLLMNGILLKRP